MPALPLLTVHDATGHVHVILGANAIASSRCLRSVDAGAHPIIVAPPDAHVHHALRSTLDAGTATRLEAAFALEHLMQLGRADVDHVVDAVFITAGGANEANARIAEYCRRQRIPVNVTDAPRLCTFTLPALYTDGPLQIGITTSGMGCKLAARIRRHIYASLPAHLGRGVERLGAMRRRIIDEDHQRAHAAAAASASVATVDDDLSDEEAPGQRADFNQLVAPATDTDADARTPRRLRWLAQICEHWPLHRLASISTADIDVLLASYAAASATTPPPASPVPTAAPRIILAGAGPGSPYLLTVATSRAIQAATLILADKLVPAAVLALIPRRTPVHIAEKFPGNAETAQTQLLEIGLRALRQGHTVLRLKQGDPYIYGRGGEEVLFFRAAGFEPLVLPGVTSALAAPLAAGVPLTHRGAADDVRICTGVGRKGVPPAPPGYVPNQTVVVLMVLNRLEDFVTSLLDDADHRGHVDLSPGSGIGDHAVPLARANPPWPLETPCAIIERATCRDQRVVRSTLRHVVGAAKAMGSRPPGLLVLGRVCSVLERRPAINAGLQREEGERDPVEVISGDGFVVEEGSSELDVLMAQLEWEAGMQEPEALVEQSA